MTKGIGILDVKFFIDVLTEYKNLVINLETSV